MFEPLDGQKQAVPERTGAATGDNWSPDEARRVRPVHRTIIAMHLRGDKAHQIAAATGRSENHIRALLCKSRVKNYIGKILDSFDQELAAKYFKVLDVMDEALDHADIQVKLKASEMWFKTQGKFKEKQIATESAEDLMRRVMESRRGQAVRIVSEERQVTRSFAAVVGIPPAAERGEISARGGTSNRPRLVGGEEKDAEGNRLRGPDVQDRPREAGSGQCAEDARPGDEAGGEPED